MRAPSKRTYVIDLFPPIEPYSHGFLSVGHGNHVYWEVCGNPQGKPALVIHGGPGQGCSPSMRQAFDPDRYKIVLFDQRGCGRSTPHASEPTTDMSVNTTHHLIADMEMLRVHLGIERWLLNGGSWGTALAVAYAERHPNRVSEMVLTSVVTFQRSENKWLYQDSGKFFPEEHARFCNVVPIEERSDIVGAYVRMLESPDSDVRERAVREWCRWEDTVVSLEPHAKPNAYSDRPSNDLTAFVRICANYVAHDAWLDEGQLLHEAHRLSEIPGVIIHGRLDLSCPFDTAWKLAQVWSRAELIGLKDSGHLKSDSKRKHLLAALNQFAQG